MLATGTAEGCGTSEVGRGTSKGFSGDAEVLLTRLFMRLRGALGTALLWGTTWFVGGLVVLAIAAWTGALPWDLVVNSAARLGRVGFFTGGAFSGLLTFAYRRRSLSDIKTLRVALGGAAVAALLSPGMAVLAGIFGGLTAGTSIKLAKHSADSTSQGVLRSAEEEPTERLSRPDHLAG